MMNKNILYICTACRAFLKKKGDYLTCADCEKQWAIIDGIPQFTEEHNYWGEISQDLMQQINKQIQKENWKDVLKRTLGEHNQEETYDFVTDLNRANWHLFLPLSGIAHVLDIGCGLGTISHSLSSHYEKIVSIETVPERLFFSKMRFQQENIQNIELVRANLLDLPFPDDSFDLVVMNGVLEWVGLSDQNKKPRDLQLLALQNIHRVLKNTGTLYIGIENRIGYSYFLGRIDHSYLQYTSLLPRPLANLYTRRKKNEDYRTYTYSYSGYQKLLNQAGFQDTNFYCPFPGYNKQNLIFELKKPALKHFIQSRTFSNYFKKKVKYSLVKTLAHLNLFKYLVNDYIIFARKNKVTLENRIIMYVKNNCEKLGLNPNHLKNLWLFGYNQSSAISFLLSNKTEPLFHIKLAQTEATVQAIEQEHKNLLKIRKNVSGELKKSIPSFSHTDNFDDSQILIQSALPGKHLIGLLNASKNPDYESERKVFFCKLDLVKNWLIEFHKSVQTGHFKFTDKECELKVTKLLANFPKKSENQKEELINQLKAAGQNSFPRIPQHGDFCDSNILINKNRVYVVDWESYSATDLPLFDVFHILTTAIISFFLFKENNPLNT
ncbi:methyltransferase domain-containing protein, partial [candidate division KSB1 bacterium]|nr:methyltransferase domain-containing protein [candidate division KSB1 bacterium]